MSFIDKFRVKAVEAPQAGTITQAAPAQAQAVAGDPGLKRYQEELRQAEAAAQAGGMTPADISSLTNDPSPTTGELGAALAAIHERLVLVEAIVAKQG